MRLRNGARHAHIMRELVDAAGTDGPMALKDGYKNPQAGTRVLNRT